MRLSIDRQFASLAKVERFQSGEHVVTTRGDAAVLEYEWEMIWVSSGERHHETGREVLVLSRRNAYWRIVWRTQIPKPEEESQRSAGRATSSGVLQNVTS